MAIHSSGSWTRNLTTWLILMAGAAVIFRLWTSLCFFPLPEWNSVRLAPSFMLHAGVTPYPGLDAGPLTTWIYGPVTLLINLPATIAGDGVSALLIAGVINLLIALVPLGLGVGALSTLGPGFDRTDRALILLLCLALWPNTSLQYIQADNTAVAFGLLSNLFLAGAQRSADSRWLAAAVCAGLAAWSKQTSLVLIIAQLIWLAWVAGPRAMIAYAGISALVLATLGAIFAAWFGYPELWLNLVTIPGRLPLCTDLTERTLTLWKHLAGDVALPAVGVALFPRVVWKRDSPWLLPTLTWLCLLPLGLMSSYKIGGASNSLNGYLYLVVPAGAALVSGLKRLRPSSARAWTTAVVIGVSIQQLGTAPWLPLSPVTAHLHQAAELARRFPDQIYFPWHPLVTWFSDRRFHHTEDGLSTRTAAQLPPSPRAVPVDLPSRWSLSAVPGWRESGYFRQLQPAAAQLSIFGKWTLFAWQPAPAIGTSESAANSPKQAAPLEAGSPPPR
jgi:hypothetical protein